LKCQLARFQNLIELNLQKNKILEIPAEFCLLRKLKKLNLAGNLLKELPDQFGKIRSQK